MPRLRPLDLALVILLALLSALVALQLGPERPDDIATPGVATGGASPVAAGPGRPDLAALAAVIAARPLFTPSRQPPPPVPPPVEPPPPSPPALAAKLVGTVTRQGRPLAIFATQEGRTVFLPPGAEVEPGFTLREVERSAVTMEGPEGVFTVERAREAAGPRQGGSGEEEFSQPRGTTEDGQRNRDYPDDGGDLGGAPPDLQVPPPEFGQEGPA